MSARRVAALLLLLALLPGCMTYRLWGYDYITDEPVRRRTTISPLDSVVARQQLVAGLAEDGEPGIALVGQPGEPAWRLRAVAGSDVALRLLGEPELVQDVVLEVTAERDLHDDEVVRASAALVLSGRGAVAAVGGIVDPATLTEEARAVLAVTRRNAFVFAADPWLYLPIVLRSCMERAAAADLAAWFGEPSQSVVIQSFVFVGSDGLPRFEPGMPVPAPATQADLPLAARLELLAPLRLLLRLDRGGVQQIVQLRPDRLWLFGACDHRDGALRHESRWLLEAAPPAVPNAAHPWRASLQCTDHRFLKVVHEPGRMALGWRLALTPLTAALDLTVLLPFTWLASELRDDDEEPRPPPQLR